MFELSSLKTVFGLAAAGLSITNLSLYARATVTRKIKPHALSWLLWSFVMAVVFVAQHVESAGPGSWVTIVGSVLCGVIGVLALFHGERHITRGDWLAFGAALSAIPLWVITKNPLGSVILLSCIDSVGYYPTFRKTHRTPHYESVTRSARAIMVCLLSIVAIENYEWTTVLYPSCIMAMEIALTAFILWRRAVQPG